MHTLARDGRQTSGIGTRRWLREATRARHDAAEARWMTAREFRSEASFLGFLSALLEAHAVLGLPAALRLGEADGIWRERTRISALCDDLGCALPETPASARMRPLYAWGVSYVLNGSALGASMLLDQACLEDHWPRRYLQLGRHFAKSGALRGHLDAVDGLPMGDGGLLRGAMDTFDMVSRAAPPRAHVGAGSGSENDG